MGQEGTPPGSLGVGERTGHDLGGQPTHRPSALVQQTGLAGELVTPGDHPQDESGVLPDARGGEYVHLCGVPEQLPDVPAQPAGHGAGIQLGLHHHPTCHDVQSPGETQDCRYLGLAGGDLGDDHPTQFVLHRASHRHAAPLPIRRRAVSCVRAVSRSRWLPAAVSWKCGFRTVRDNGVARMGARRAPCTRRCLLNSPVILHRPGQHRTQGAGKCRRIVPRSCRVGNPGQFQTGTHTLRGCRKSPW